MSLASPLMWVNGIATNGAAISVLDWAVQRGDGCFEVFRSYDGRGFAVDEHIKRLEWSAQQLDLALPPYDDLLEWALEAARQGGECTVRMMATRGSPTYDTEPTVIVISEPVPEIPQELRLTMIDAPWHSAGRPWDLAGVKSLSYGPNMAASRRARMLGFHDAILVSDLGLVLEGPTLAVGWVRDGVLETPGLDLLILDSITRRHVLALARAHGIETVEGSFHKERLLGADEVFVMSTVREVTPVVEVSDYVYPTGPVTIKLAEAFRNRTQS